MTERRHFHFSLSCIGEGNGNPLQCSCLENPRDGGAWRAFVYGVAQSRTRLKRLSSSSSSSAWSKPICTLFPTVFAQLTSMCHIFLILTIFQTFSSLLYLLWDLELITFDTVIVKRLQPKEDSKEILSFSVRSVQSLCVSDSLQPRGLQHTRPLCPSPTPEAYSDSCPYVSDAIQPSHPLLSPSPPGFNLSQHQGLFNELAL